MSESHRQPTNSTHGTSPESIEELEELFHIPRPTMWPAVMAAGVTAVMAGVILSLWITLVGLIIFFIAVAGWIEDFRHAR